MFCSGIVFSQPIEPTPDYKYVLRIQREIESQIGYYLDEPKTGNLKKVHLERNGGITRPKMSPYRVMNIINALQICYYITICIVINTIVVQLERNCIATTKLP